MDWFTIGVQLLTPQVIAALSVMCSITWPSVIYTKKPQTKQNKKTGLFREFWFYPENKYQRYKECGSFCDNVLFVTR